MDVISREYEEDVRPYRDSDLTFRRHWYRARPGALQHPYPGVFGSLYWRVDGVDIPEGVGAVEGTYRLTRRRRPPVAGAIVGTQDEWENGLTLPANRERRPGGFYVRICAQATGDFCLFLRDTPRIIFEVRLSGTEEGGGVMAIQIGQEVIDCPGLGLLINTAGGVLDCIQGGGDGSYVVTVSGSDIDLSSLSDAVTDVLDGGVTTTGSFTTTGTVTAGGFTTGGTVSANSVSATTVIGTTVRGNTITPTGSSGSFSGQWTFGSLVTFNNGLTVGGGTLTVTNALSASSSGGVVVRHNTTFSPTTGTPNPKMTFGATNSLGTKPTAGILIAPHITTSGDPSFSTDKGELYVGHDGSIYVGDGNTGATVRHVPHSPGVAGATWWEKYTLDLATLQAAGATDTNTFTLGTLPARTFIRRALVYATEQLAGTGLSSTVGNLGVYNSFGFNSILGYNKAHLAVDENSYTTGVASNQWTSSMLNPYNVSFSLVLFGTLYNLLTAGEIEIYVAMEKLPD